jgi:endonuclease YncB( thermonuclease family)
MSFATRFLFSLAIGLLLTSRLGLAASLIGTAEIIDGDTIKIAGQPVRLFGIDAPEGRQRCEANGANYECGRRATEFLSNLISGRSVECNIVGVDRFERSLGVCVVDGAEINRRMVQAGWALAFVKYSNRYATDEKGARSSKAGVWAGRFSDPWDWRLEAATAAQKTITGNCTIKGNIARSGKRIYHLSSQEFYERTSIDESKGERWFCSEEEALKSGWRRALR